MKVLNEVRLPESDQELREFLERGHGRPALGRPRRTHPLGEPRRAGPRRDGPRPSTSAGTSRIFSSSRRPPPTFSVGSPARRASRPTRPRSEPRTAPSSGSSSMEAASSARDGSSTAASSPETSRASWSREQAARHRVEATSLLKDEFLALLSHELRTPLGAILVWLGLLRQGGFDPAESAAGARDHRAQRPLARAHHRRPAPRVANRRGRSHAPPAARRPPERRTGRRRRRGGRRDPEGRDPRGARRRSTRVG